MLPVAPTVLTTEELNRKIQEAPAGVRTIAFGARDHHDRALGMRETFTTLVQEAKSRMLTGETARRGKIAFLTQRIAGSRATRQAAETEREQMDRQFTHLVGHEALNIEPTADAEAQIQNHLRKQEGFDPDLREALAAQVRELSIPTPVSALPPVPALVTDDDLPPLPGPIQAAPLRVVEKPEDLVQMETELNENAVGANEHRLPALFWGLVLTSIIFGASMALFTGFLTMRGLTQGNPASVAVSLIVGSVCAVILFYTGYTLRGGWREIAEFLHGEMQVVPIGTFLFTVIASFFAIAETLLEGKAIQAYRFFQADKANLLHQGSGHMEGFWMYWIMGCLIAGPILLAESYSGWRTVTGRIRRHGQVEEVVSGLRKAHQAEQEHENELYQRRISDAEAERRIQISEREQRREELVAERARQFEQVKARRLEEFNGKEEARKTALREAQAALADQDVRREKGDLRYRRSNYLHEAVQLVGPILTRQRVIEELTAQINADDAELLHLMSNPTVIDPDLARQCSELTRQIEAEMQKATKLACGIPLHH